MFNYYVYGKNSSKGFNDLKSAKVFASKLAKRLGVDVEITRYQKEWNGASWTTHLKINSEGIVFNFVRGSWVQNGFKMLEDGRIVPVNQHIVSEAA
jgi:hypothetical protein